MNLPEAKTGKRLHDVRLGNNFMNATPKTQTTRTTITIGPHQTKMLLLSKRNNQQNEKKTYGMGENI